MHVDIASLLMSIIATTPSNTSFHPAKKKESAQDIRDRERKTPIRNNIWMLRIQPPPSVMSKKTYAVMVLSVYACMCHEYDAVTPDALMVGS
jgi:hypothetical protein